MDKRGRFKRGGPGVAIKGNTGGCDIDSNSSVGWSAIFLSFSAVRRRRYGFTLTVRIGEGIMSEGWNNRDQTHRVGDAT